MSKEKLNIALFTPSLNPYSETFIQAHKKYLEGTIFYYYGEGNAIQLLNSNALTTPITNLILKLYAKVTKKPSSYIWQQRVIKSVKAAKIDVILVEYGTHAHHLKNVLKQIGLPVVVHFHGYDASTYKILERCHNYKDVFGLSTKVVAVSRKMEQMLLNIGCPSHKLEYNVYGPQPEFSEVTARFTKKQFVGIGRFTDKKAPYYTILAFKEVLDAHPDAKLVLAGDGVLLNAVQNLVKYYGLENHVQLVGVVKPEVYRALLEESLAFVQHSITAADGDMEGTPLAILEAASAGLPVISTIHAGIPDVIIHDETGLLSAEHDVSKMSQHMLYLLGDIELAKKLGTASRQNIHNNFTLKRHIDTLLDILKQAIETN